MLSKVYFESSLVLLAKLFTSLKFTFPIIVNECISVANCYILNMEVLTTQNGFFLGT